MTMLRAMRLGACEISSVIEYTAPTPNPAVLFPGLDAARAAELGGRIGLGHYVASMDRLVITVQIWVIRAGSRVILVDAGVGNHKTRALPRMNRLNTQLPAWLEAAGATPASVTHVMHTHLHGDHVGWNTTLIDGRWEPTFPHARTLIPRRDYEHYRAALRDGTDPIIDQSFEDSILPLVDAGLVQLIDPGTDVLDCLEVVALPGHSVGHVGYRLHSGGERALFCGDVLHSPMQVCDPTLNTSYCAQPELARRTRRTLLDDAAASGELVLPMHFGAPYCGYVRRSGDGFTFEGAVWPEPDDASDAARAATAPFIEETST